MMDIYQRSYLWASLFPKLNNRRKSVPLKSERKKSELETNAVPKRKQPKK